MTAAVNLVKPGGALILATLNRTAKGFLLGKIAAEYILRWLPVGTHTWEKLVTPDELEAALKAGGLAVVEESGIMYDLFRDAWRRGTEHITRSTMVFRKEDGDWRVVHVHFSEAATTPRPGGV